MVERISVQIALEGGKEVEAQLKGIGDAGKKAFEDLAKSAEQVGGFKNLKPEDVTQKLNELGVAGTEAFGQIQQAVSTAVRFENVVQGVQAVETGLLNLAKVGGGIGAGLAAAFALAIGPTRAFAAAVQEVDANAIKLGLGIAQFDRLRAGLLGAGLSSDAASSGIAKLKENIDKLDIQRVATAFQQIQEATKLGFAITPGSSAQLRVLLDAAQGVGEAAKQAKDALVQLGVVSIGNANKTALEQLGVTARNVAQALPEVVEKLRQMPDSVNRSAIAIELLGQKAGVELIQALRTGGVAVDQFVEKQKQLTQDQANAATLLGQSFNILSEAWSRFTRSLVLAPAVTAGIQTLTSLITGLAQALEIIKKLSESGIFKILGNALSTAIPVALDSPILRFIQRLLGIPSAAEQAKKALEELNKEAGKKPLIGGDATARFMKVIQVPTGTGALQSTSDKMKLINNEFFKTTQAAQVAQTAGVSAWDAIGTSIANDIRGVQEFATLLAGIAWETVSTGAVTAWNAVFTLVSNASRAVQQFVGQLAGDIWSSITSGASAAWGTVVKLVVDAATAVTNFSTQMASIAWDSLTSAATSAWNTVSSGIQTAIDRLAAFVTQQKQSGAGSGLFGGGMAGGGLIGGRGTGTSDSNLAWVSRGEHIMPARAVRQPGVLAFLEMLRASGGNIERVMDRMGRFALGGMAMPRAFPAFADGGLVGQSNVTIAFPGLPPISGLRASSDVVNELRRAAGLAQVRSGGRKPSRYS